MATLNWKTAKSDFEIIDRISVRAHLLAKRVGHDIPSVEFMMDVTACHANAFPLNLEGLATAPDFDFAHDVFGIRRHLNRNTGQLEDCFVPRHAIK